MAQTIKLKRSATQGAAGIPSTSQLELGEVGINTHTGKVYIKKNDGSDAIVEVGAGIAGASTDLSLDQFTGDGSTVAFTMGAKATINNTFVYFGGVYQSKSNYTVSSADPAVITFSTAPPNTAPVEVTSAAVLGFASTNITLDQFTGDGSTVLFTLGTSTTENNTFIYIDGVYQNKSTYSVSTATPAVVTFSEAPPAATEVEVMSPNILAQAGAVLDSDLTSSADVKALNQSVVSGATPTFGIANMTLDDTNLVAVDTTNLQTFADGVDHALLKARGTGVSSTYVSTVAVGGTTFAQPAIVGEINSDQGYLSISYAGATGIAVSDLTAMSTYVYIDNAGALQQQVTIPTRQDWSRNIFTMRIAVNTVTEKIVGFEYMNNPIGHYANSIRDLYTYLQAQGVPFRIGQTVTGRTDNLGFDVGAGSVMEFGGTGDIHNPNIKSFDAVANASYILLTRTTSSAGNTDLVKYWDNAGTITALGSTTCVGHRLYRFSNGTFTIQYGQGNYANMILAKAGARLEEYVLNPGLVDATFMGWWLIEETATATSGTVAAEFVEYTIGVQGGSSSSLAGCLLKGNNLSDLLDASAARSNLGLGTSSSPTFLELTLSGTDSLKLPAGTTAQRPTGVAGDMRYNSETAGFEGFTDAWSGIGGLDAAYFTTTPTLTSPSDNTITVGNYSSFSNPVFVTKVGSTVLEHVDTAGSIALTATATGSQTVSVEVRESGKLQSIGNTIVMDLQVSNAARYWRMTGIVKGDNSASPAFSGWQLYPQTGQGGTKLGAANVITASYNSSSSNEANLYANETTGGLNWYLWNYTGTLADHWCMYDLGSDMDVQSMKIVPYSTTSGHWSSNITIQSSKDNVTWTTVHTITNTAPHGILTFDIT